MRRSQRAVSFETTFRRCGASQFLGLSGWLRVLAVAKLPNDVASSSALRSLSFTPWRKPTVQMERRNKTHPV